MVARWLDQGFSTVCTPFLNMYNSAKVLPVFKVAYSLLITFDAVMFSLLGRPINPLKVTLAWLIRQICLAANRKLIMSYTMWVLPYGMYMECIMLIKPISNIALMLK